MSYEITVRQIFSTAPYSYTPEEGWTWRVEDSGTYIDSGVGTSETHARQLAEKAAKLDHARNNAKVTTYEYDPDAK